MKNKGYTPTLTWEAKILLVALLIITVSFGIYLIERNPITVDALCTTIFAVLIQISDS